MKIVCLLLILILVSCQHNTDGKATFIGGDTLKTNNFTIITDTLDISETDFNIVPELKHNEHYYCSSYIKDSVAEYKSGSYYIIDEKNNIKKIDGMPGYSEFVYNDLYIQHDSIMVSTYYDSDSTSYLNEKEKQWQNIKVTDDVIFEDNNYYVTALEFGEWGSATWFKDKKTGIEYEAAGILPPEIKKFKGKYYLIRPGEINIVENPRQLYNVGKGAYRSFLGKGAIEKFSSRKRSTEQQGMKNIFSRNLTYEREDNFLIGPSLIHNGEVCFIVNDSAQINIVKVRDRKLIPLATVGNNLHTLRPTNKYRNYTLIELYGFIQKIVNYMDCLKSGIATYLFIM